MTKNRCDGERNSCKFTFHKTQVALIAGLCGACVGLMLVLGAVAYKVHVVRHTKVNSFHLGRGAFLNRVQASCTLSRTLLFYS